MNAKLLPNVPSPAKSALMRRVRRQDTAPELAVRCVLHAAGLRFRLHDKQLPGTPDIVLPRRRTVIFVHGCFWHAHDCRRGLIRAKSNADFWASKLETNRARDRAKERALRALGWRVDVIWECECRDTNRLGRLCRRLLQR